MKNKAIPWANPHYWGNEIEYVTKAIQSTWISGGSYVDKLETDFARFCNIDHCVATSNGTTALHLAYLAGGIQAGDEIIVPGFGFMAAANVAIHMGARPIIADVDPASWCMATENLESLITAKTKAIIPIHTYGNVCDMDSIVSIAEKHKLLVIEDAAEAIGSKYKGKMAGTIASLGTYSFHATKTITTGEGGSVVSSSVELANKMRVLRSHGMSQKRYWHDVAGHNFRLTNMQAAIGCAQLEKIDVIRVARNRIYKMYQIWLQNSHGITFQKIENNVEPLIWAVGIKLDKRAYPQGRDGVIKQLEELDIETRPGFYAASMMKHLYGEIKSPVSDDVSAQTISLPSSPTLTEDNINYICSSLISLQR